MMEEGKNKSASWADLHAVFLAVMEELNSGKSTYVWGFVFLLAQGQWKTGLLKVCLKRHRPMEITLGIYGAKVRHGDVHYKNPLPGSGGIWNCQVNLLKSSPGSMK